MEEMQVTPTKEWLKLWMEKQGAAELPAGPVRIFRAGGGRRLSGAHRSGRFMSAAQRVTGCI